MRTNEVANMIIETIWPTFNSIVATPLRLSPQAIASVLAAVFVTAYLLTGPFLKLSPLAVLEF